MRLYALRVQTEIDSKTIKSPIIIMRMLKPEQSVQEAEKLFFRGFVC